MTGTKAAVSHFRHSGAFLSFRVVFLSSSCQVPLLSLPVFFRHTGKLPFLSHSRRVSQPSSFRASVSETRSPSLKWHGTANRHNFIECYQLLPR